MNSAIRPYSVGILAGGKSSRMGKNKALLEYESDTFIGHAIKEFQGHEIIISASGQKEYEKLPAKIVSDENMDIGPIEGIRQILTAASEDYVFVCACDMPFITDKIADYIAEFISSDYDCYVITDEDRMHPLCAIYSKRVLPIIEKLIANGEYKIRLILENARTKYISLENTTFEKKIVRNVNTKEEYRELKKPVIFAVSGYKDSGKTWLIAELINEFIKDGFSVGVVKHDGHDSIAEAEGTDTYKYACAGAAVTAVYSDSKYVISGTGKADPEDLIDHIKASSNPPQIIILEGFKSSSYPKIVLGKDGEFPPVDESTVILKINGRCDANEVVRIFNAVKKYLDL
ncbi:MAG: molybdopterin-guanine dinucleotide biosynthesis protein B [Clostridiales bacterium]|nr:molybdopterin-guanine dinucleotide biosynthesis protein B [Clostridiales bacterium]